MSIFSVVGDRVQFWLWSGRAVWSLPTHPRYVALTGLAHQLGASPQAPSR